ncbi:MAG: hypothetical protein EPO68_11800, partial [Planctomycetota bacterium]
MPAHRSLAAGLVIAGCIATRGAFAQVTITTGVPIQLGGVEEVFDYSEIEALMAAQGGAVVAPTAAPSSSGN